MVEREDIQFQPNDDEVEAEMSVHLPLFPDADDLHPEQFIRSIEAILDGYGASELGLGGREVGVLERINNLVEATGTLCDELGISVDELIFMAYEARENKM